MKKKDLKHSDIISVMNYDSVSGKFFKLSGELIPETSLMLNGSTLICIPTFNLRVLTHHAAWFYTYGYWPEKVDHKDRVKYNNAISNLRLATVAENNINRIKQSNNTSGYKGVYFHKPSGLYRSLIGFKGKYLSLGYYSEPELAFLIRQAAEIDLYGNFAYLGE